MAKRKEPEKPIVKDDPSRILDINMEDVMHNSMMPYAEHVILERALPRVEDGLKPVQRRILYTMMELGTTPDKPHRKCARIVGDCLGKYHPHGDSSVYGALVHMAQDFSMRCPMVDGHGNFGSIDGDGAAAMRYTEARMTPLAMEMLRDIEKDTVPFRLNFDDTLKEPDMLPARFPNLLVNGANGIAVGLATNIPTHNLGEAVRAVVAQMENPDITLDELMQILPGPDFPTGGVLLRNEEIRRGYETGKGKLTLRARVHVEDGASGRKLLVITEIPYQVNKAAMLEKIQKLSEDKKVAEKAPEPVKKKEVKEAKKAEKTEKAEKKEAEKTEKKEIKEKDKEAKKNNKRKNKKASSSKKEVSAEADVKPSEAPEAEAAAPAPKKKAVIPDLNDEQIAEIKKKAHEFLVGIFETMDMSVEISEDYQKDTGILTVNMEGEDMGVLIGKRGQTLDSLQYLVSLVVNKGVDGYVHVKADTENYRERRKKTLENLAKNIAFKVKRTRQSVALEPMNPYERRIIHSALQNEKYITTYSEGEEPYRKVVVALKKDENGEELLKEERFEKGGRGRGGRGGRNNRGGRRRDYKGNRERRNADPAQESESQE